MSRYGRKSSRYGAVSGNGRYRGSDRGPYRARNGAIMGVFAGLADYFDLSVTWIRIIGVAILFVSGLWPVVGLYLVAALIMKPEPVVPLESIDETEFYDSYTHSRTNAIHRMKQKFKSLNRRIQRMEDIVTDREFDWDRRFNGER